MKRSKPLARTAWKRKPLDPEKLKQKKRAARIRQRELWERDFGPHAGFVRSHPCACCGTGRDIESHHEPDRRHGGSMKDQTPLCRRCHREAPNARHKMGRAAFERMYKLDLRALAARLWAESPFNPDRTRDGDSHGPAGRPS